MLKRGQLITAAARDGAYLTDNGTLCITTGKHTGRSPNAKKIVCDEKTQNAVDWSSNQKMETSDFLDLKQKATKWIQERERKNLRGPYRQFVKAGRDDKSSLLVEIITERPEHALFVQNMFVPTKTMGKPDLKVWSLPSLTTEPVVAMNMSTNEIIISGTRYAGEIKKSVFTYMNFTYPEVGILPMHCSVNVSRDEKDPTATIFFGLSGTGKTTLSADSNRYLIGDDEHGWSHDRVFNFENGCYAKTIGLNPETEPEIYNAVNQFGAILENVVVTNSLPNFEDTSLTQNGRASYPLSYVEGASETGVFIGQPSNIVMLTCDAFGVLPAVAKLTISQAREQFLMGYTAKVAGTEVGVSTPKVTFSACFGAPFMPRNPETYGDMLVEKVTESSAQCWLVNTGWFGGPPGIGKRIDLNVTRKIIEMINDGTLSQVKTKQHTRSGFHVPVTNKVPKKFLFPKEAWDSEEKYEIELEKLMTMMEDQKLQYGK